ncbi:MAG: hypothetical protein JRI97_04050 [Deltaproteobacteria bacterium]|nr:hypothetical protein [Deltaproteobacteria bacterium]
MTPRASRRPAPFDRSRLALLPLDRRIHDMNADQILDLTPVEESRIPGPLAETARRVVRARREGAPVLFMMGAHVLRSGVQRYLADLMERGYISAVAANGACAIHDFELALIGATTESVAKYIAEGRFGLWRETGRINDVVNKAYAADPEAGYGQALGREIWNGDYPHKDISLFAAGERFSVPVLVHVALGQDIIHEHPNFNPEAAARLSYNDFLTLASVVEGLSNGVVMNFGTAVMGPEVFLKALAMARNAARQQGRAVERFSTLVADLRDLGENPCSGSDHGTETYYFRPQKTLLVRTLAGGDSFYVRGKHADTVPALWTAVGLAENEERKA